MGAIRRFLDKAHRYLGNIVALLLVIELVGFIGNFVGEHVAGASVAAWLQAHRNLIETSGEATALLILLLSVAGWHRARRAHRSSQQMLQAATDESAKLSATLNAQLAELGAQLKETSDNLNRQLKESVDIVAIYEKTEELFTVLASQNARHDRKIFDRLFVRRGQRITRSRQEEIQSAIGEARSNIQEILNVTQTIFSLVTGEKCGVCVQVATLEDSRNKRDAIIKTIIRDSGSAAIRNAPSDGHRVEENTIHLRIFVEGDPIVCIDDLRAARAEGKFGTTSKSWDRFYNAALVAAVPVMENESMPRATLCIDNMKGGLTATYCQRLATELVWRLAVKLYRLDEMMKSVG